MISIRSKSSSLFQTSCSSSIRKRHIRSNLCDEASSLTRMRSCTRQIEFLVIRSSLAVSIVSCRHPIQLFYFWPRGNNDLSQNVRRTKSLAHFFLNDDVPPLNKTTPASNTIAPSPPKNHEATRATFPEMGRLVDDLYNRQDLTIEFAFIFFL